MLPHSFTFMKQMEGRKDEIREERKPLTYIDHYYVLVTILVAIPFIIPLKALKKKNLGERIFLPRVEVT